MKNGAPDRGLDIVYSNVVQNENGHFAGTEANDGTHKVVVKAQ